MKNTQKIGLVLGPIVFVLLLLFFKPEGLSTEGRAVLAATAWIAIWWITEAIPIAVTALLPIALFTLSGGLNLSWNLFDGGATITRVRNAKVNLETQQLQKENILLSIQRDFDNAWDDYMNKLEIYNIQEKNIITAQNNFDRTQEKFKIGQVNSIEFRQAQLNLLNTELSRNQAKYAAKLAELQLLQISGELLNVEF